LLNLIIVVVSELSVLHLSGLFLINRDEIKLYNYGGGIGAAYGFGWGICTGKKEAGAITFTQK